MELKQLRLDSDLMKRKREREREREEREREKCGWISSSPIFIVAVLKNMIVDGNRFTSVSKNSLVMLFGWGPS
jgi:hypothetical protein